MPLQRGRCSVGIHSIAICQSIHATDFLQSDPPPTTTGRASERASDSCGHGHSIKLMLTAVIHFVTRAGTEATAVAPDPTIRVRPSSVCHTAVDDLVRLLTWHGLFPLLRLQDPISAPSDVKENQVVLGIMFAPSEPHLRSHLLLPMMGT